ncbi:winged helix-turn-helix domain-containing protein [Phytoactinopolyspora endophytica]|uniref:winged helix-turn-helix domain-containing protein n=1 Tax=Phytoactinopolyspora endophytica TaxID=1642495 RepID=UPI00197C64D2|nr:winged helix-turn-helix domain-containing protein [Phytoactinopolyspora endophytica]
MTPTHAAELIALSVDSAVLNGQMCTCGHRHDKHGSTTAPPDETTPGGCAYCRCTCFDHAGWSSQACIDGFLHPTKRGMPEAEAQFRRFVPEPAGGRYVYEQFADHITTMIKARGLRSGAPLPACRRLARATGVSHVTAMQAMRVLRVRGTVTVMPSKGTYVCDPGGEPG